MTRSTSNTVTLVTGGCRSGKSRFAEELACQAQTPRCYIATAEIFDEEMRARVDLHRAQRGEAYETVEAPIDLAGAITAVPEATQVILVDCLTVWLGNLMHHKEDFSEHCAEVQALLEVLKAPPCPIVFVTNELGMGLVPETSMGRRFRDVAGRLNQQVAALANEAFFIVSGLPLKLK
ncbi:MULTISPECIES: bifunctional adenosylcobinamide kinase/adenosylcobinamide-phosphate guanylyltransferase [unclassified Lentimonas]|uniref:bifunctional adenosylcobinamide kinase/adenosylcobinamide-phosphate guanylyltransferase n=1 Tax=unclassified Lentimonas TaxID=2630993 RepID=UPI0013276449|nr:MULTISPECIES: bifunctional adenosylcobinamide kinase/adenosylcobinamide-phosphate guanylyltransferase [unclassified Lentimonas]CAA6679503.1 Adenosylcobinamide-phosphate guanylyltransferase (EC [Lentimonas sp. CC4]CAA6687174.1 Adenosylcobinamide-phosphate guanylyltransferase (EC [Lentimonas sp. CC6]CAA6691590.1 Adenosylcobinamide-phosphate guanylyltransferase (EC [Lentimonas sp. CC10]CAA6696261.1 Adenosylcobinamide-phosphate guanylyltransferase (EC [Lentimonas sp. CC19]CAA7070858.1 Adenosylc